MTERGLRTYRDAVAIVTGGASGIGLALAQSLARRGAEVVLADRQIDVAHEHAASIEASGGHARAVELDVTDFAVFQRVVDETADRAGRLDYLFNNAGIGIGGEAQLYSIDDWRAVLDVDLHGVVNGVQAAYPVMIRQGFGHLVNTASMAGLLPAPLAVSYSVAKHAVVGLSTSLRIEAEPLGVWVSALCPGVIRTPILDGGKYGKNLESISLEQQRRNWERLRPMAPEAFAEKALDAVARNRPMIILPSWWRWIWRLNRLSPALGSAFSRRLYRAARRQIDEAQATAAGT